MTAPVPTCDGKRTVVIGDDEPSVVTAFPLDHLAPTLGLDAPMRLAGGASLAPGGLALATGLDHFPGLRAFLAEACRRQVLAGRAWFGHPPLVFAGAPGTGRGLVARRIADLSGVPLHEVSLEEFRATANRAAAGRPTPPLPALAMAMTRCANPIVLLTLPDQGREREILSDLSEWMDGLRSARWLSGSTRTIFDLSHVSWMLQTRSPSPLLADVLGDHGIIVAADEPDEVGEELRLLSVAMQVAGVDGRGDAALVDELFEGLRDLSDPTGRSSGKDLVRHAVLHRERLRSGR